MVCPHVTSKPAPKAWHPARFASPEHHRLAVNVASQVGSQLDAVTTEQPTIVIHHAHPLLVPIEVDPGKVDLPLETKLGGGMVDLRVVPPGSPSVKHLLGDVRSQSRVVAAEPSEVF